MESTYTRAMQDLARTGWRVELLVQPQPLPEEVVARYPWMPSGFRQFVEQTACACSPDETAWLLTARDFGMGSGSPYRWNEWERLSLEAAGNDEPWRRAIVEFWDAHVPMLLSVKSGYAYFAIERGSLQVVRGEEPEFEDATPVAASVLEVLETICSRGAELARWL